MSNSTVSSNSASSFYTQNGVTRMNGTEFASGLDTQKLIDAMTARTQNKINRQKQLEQKATWKRDMYRDVEALLQTFSDSYFSFATSSKTNIMSSSFFDSGALVSSNSSIISATGGAQDAGNVIINNISQIASAASLSSGYQVSQENITSGNIQNSWTSSAVGGNSMVIHYGGQDYTISLSYSTTLDSSKSSDDNLKALADGLNNSINGTSGISGKVRFSVQQVDAADPSKGSKLIATSTDSSNISIKAYKASNNDTTGADFLKALNIADGSSGASITSTAGIKAGTDIDASHTTVNNVTNSPLFNQTISSSSYLDVSINGGSTIRLTLGTDINLSGATQDQMTKAISDALNSQIKANSALNGLSVTNSTDGSGKITLSDSSGITIKGGSQNLLQGLGLAVNDSGTTLTHSIDKGKLTTSYLGDSLAGSSLTFSLDGVNKTITFADSDEALYSTASDIKTYLQSKLDAVYGGGKINVKFDNSGTNNKLVFSTTDNTSTLKISSSTASNVLDSNGALRIQAGETNRTETSKTLKELSNELNTQLTTTSTDTYGNKVYTINVNGKNFSFDENTELNTVINKINDDNDAGVTISYSQTTNKFRISSDDTGAQGKISISDTTGNLAQSLFGLDYSNISGVQTTNTYPLSTGATDSVYSFQLGGNAAETITIPNGKTYGSADEFARDIQNTINSNSNLKNKISVEATSDGKLTFNSMDGSVLKIAESNSSTSDILGIGTSGKSTLDTSKTLAELAASSNGSITQDGVTSNYNITVNGKVYTFSGTTKLSDIGYSGITNGTDLKMNATLGGVKQDITRSTNSFTLDGVSLTVSGTTKAGDSPITFSASNNVDDLYKKISDFVDAYNKIIDKANTYVSQTPYGLNSDAGTNTKYDPLTDAQKKEMTDDEIKQWNDKAKQGLLQNDNTLNTLLTNIRSAMEDKVSSVGLSLSDIGISTAAYDYTSGGKLVIDTEKLKSKLRSDPEKVSQLFTNDDGVSARVKKVIVKNIGTYGNSGALVDMAGSSTMIGVDNSQIGTQISDYEKVIKNLQTQLKTEQDRWQTKFSRMESMVYKLSNQYNYLSSMTSGS